MAAELVELVAEEPEEPGRGTPREEREEAPILAEELAEAVLLAVMAVTLGLELLEVPALC